MRAHDRVHISETGKHLSAARRLLRLARPELGLLTTGWTCLLLSTAVSVALPYTLGRIISAGAAPNDPALSNVSLSPAESGDSWASTLRLSGIFMILYVLGAAMTAARVYLFGTVSVRLVRRLRTRLFRVIVVQPMPFFDGGEHGHTGEVISRLSSDCDQIQVCHIRFGCQLVLSTHLMMSMRFLLQVIGAMAFLFYLSWQLTLALLILFPFLGIGAVCKASKRMRSLALTRSSPLSSMSRPLRRRRRR